MVVHEAYFFDFEKSLAKLDKGEMVYVQDLGAYHFIKQKRPDLKICYENKMGKLNKEAIKFLNQYFDKVEVQSGKPFLIQQSYRRFLSDCLGQKKAQKVKYIEDADQPGKLLRCRENEKGTFIWAEEETPLTVSVRKVADKEETRLSAVVLDSVNGKNFTVEVWQQIMVGEEFMLKTPEGKQIILKINRMWDLKDVLQEKADKGQLIKISWHKGVVPGSKLWKEEEGFDVKKF